MIGKTHWIMFIFGFLLDKINLFPFILGIFFGLYISKNTIINFDFSSIEILFSYVKEYINSIFDEHTNIHEKMDNSEKKSEKSINSLQEEKET